MIGYSTVPDKAVSIVRGIPLEEEPGLGSLTLSGFIREVTRMYGSREAIAQPRPEGLVERWTYDDLWTRSMDVARALVACGTGKATRVGILMTNRAEFVSAVFGTALAGGIATPLSTFSTPAELDHLIAASACSVLLVEPRVRKKDFVAIIGELAPEIASAGPGRIVSLKYPFLRHVVSLDRDAPAGGIEPWAGFLAHGAGVSEEQVEARAATVMPADPGVLFFSSGTTGRPKGILSAHRAVSIQLWRWPRIFGVPGPERCWSVNGFFWSGPFGMALGTALSRGGTLVMQSTFDAEEALSLMASEKVTIPFGWPHQWAQLEGAPNWNDVDLSALHCVAAENPLSKHPTVKTDWQEPTRIYGNTETFTLSSAYPSGTPKEIIGDAWGFPLPGMTFKIVDPFTGKVMPMGERGEIAVKGATLMLGYIGVPLDETLDDEGFFRTGDGGYADEQGRIYWEGRLNDIIKTGGANVSPVEIDAILIQCPGVRLVQTVGVPDDLLGELVVACIVLQDGASLDEEAVRNFAKEKIASYKVPRRVLFFAEKQFSTTGSAKVKTAQMRKLAAERLKVPA
ncbi:MAG: class I adenylate-forming enzyme family protein [Rhizomicrobium sp.]